MVKGCGMSCVKTLLLAFNFVFVLSGILLIVLGGLALSEVDKMDGVLEKQDYRAPCILFIVVGCIVFVVAFFGCCGAMQESHCMLIMFSVFLFLILAVELAAGILGFVYKEKLKEGVLEAMDESMKKYADEPNGKESPQKISWDKVQKNLKCCGVNGSADWYKLLKNIPPSCCGGKDPCVPGLAYSKGCYEAVKDILKSNILYIAIAGVILGLIEIFGIVFACCLASEVRGRS